MDPPNRPSLPRLRDVISPDHFSNMPSPTSLPSATASGFGDAMDHQYTQSSHPYENSARPLSSQGSTDSLCATPRSAAPAARKPTKTEVRRHNLKVAEFYHKYGRNEICGRFDDPACPMLEDESSSDSSKTRKETYNRHLLGGLMIVLQNLLQEQGSWRGERLQSSSNGQQSGLDFQKHELLDHCAFFLSRLWVHASAEAQQRARNDLRVRANNRSAMFDPSLFQ